MHKSYKIFSLPYFIWLILLAFLPIVIMFVLIFTDGEGLNFNEITFGVSAFSLFDGYTLIALLNSVLYAVIATALCIVLGYIVSYTLYISKIKNKRIILIFFILPMWSNLLLRIQAFGRLLEPNNIITSMLSNIGIHMSINANGTWFSVVLGMVVTYLPFMILPIYNSLEKIDKSYNEASLDLGLTEAKTFWKVTVPLSLKGIISGSIMVLLPSLSGFAIPKILGKGTIPLIGTIIEQSFMNMSYNFGSLLSIFLLIIIFAGLFFVFKSDKEGESLL
ncbi:MAG: ABC transporter permease [Acholeplasmatales bacterium]|jgi:spermidine/putrescine transport system permease protein|nr:ABC transporter permease [Acholeplasmatales bacterium]